MATRFTVRDAENQADAAVRLCALTGDPVRGAVMHIQNFEDGEVWYSIDMPEDS